jgi:hypothetical protein
VPGGRDLLRGSGCPLVAGRELSLFLDLKAGILDLCLDVEGARTDGSNFLIGSPRALSRAGQGVTGADRDLPGADDAVPGVDRRVTGVGRGLLGAGREAPAPGSTVSPPAPL